MYIDGIISTSSSKISVVKETTFRDYIFKTHPCSGQSAEQMALDFSGSSNWNQILMTEKKRTLCALPFLTL